MSIIIEDEVEISFKFPYKEVIENVIQYSLDYVECPYEAEVNVLLTDNEAICEINNTHRGIDTATDVLSFPFVEYSNPARFEGLEDSGEYFNPESGELMLGDIVISVEKVISQADLYGHSELRELAFLTAHSMLHLFGYDHMKEEERREMETRQNEILNALNITR